MCILHCALHYRAPHNLWLMTIKSKAAHDSLKIMGRNIKWIFPKGFSEYKCVNNISKMATQWIMHRPHRPGREGRGWKYSVQMEPSPAQPSPATEPRLVQLQTLQGYRVLQNIWIWLIWQASLLNLVFINKCRNQKWNDSKLNKVRQISQKSNFISVSLGSNILQSKITNIFLFKKTHDIHKTLKIPIYRPVRFTRWSATPCI